MGLAVALVMSLAGGFLALAGTARGGTEILREAYAPSTWDNGFLNVWENQAVAQAFVARTDFLLTHVELFLFDQPETTGADILQVFIAADAGNHPGSLLGGTAKEGFRNWTWVPFGFSPWVPLRVGQRYWIVAEDAQPRPKGYEWAMNTVGSYSGGEAQSFDPNMGAWSNNTGSDLFFRVFGVSGPSILLQAEPTLAPVDPGESVALDLYFNNSGNDVADTVSIDVNLPRGLTYLADDANLEGGVQTSPQRWTFADVGAGSHRMTVWARVDPSPAYYDGQPLSAWTFLNYTDASGLRQAPSWDVATFTVLVPVIRAQAYPSPPHVSPGETFNFTVSFFNVGSGEASHLWINASAGDRLTILGGDAAAEGGTPTGPSSWLFRNVGAQAYVFNVTVQAASDALRGDRLALGLDLAYTDGMGNPFASRRAVGLATIHGPSLVVEATAETPRPHPGNVVRVVLFANNTGDEHASRAWLNATLPAWTDLADSQPIAGSRTGSSVAYAMSDVAPGVVALTLTLRVGTDAPPGSPIGLSASLNVSDADGRILRPSNAATEGVVISPRFLVRLDSTRRYVAPGDPVDLVLTWNNTGNEAARRVWLNFTLPAKALLVNTTIPWASTDGTTFGWAFSDVGLGERTIGVRLEASARVAEGDALVALLTFRYERSDGAMSTPTVAALEIEGRLGGAASLGFELVLLWIAILIAVFLLFLLLGYMDVLPRRRTTIDDVFLLHNSGILVCHYSTTLRPDVDSDIASGMLMAVRNFVADALRSKNGSLQELKYGDHRIHMVHGTHAILVTFTRGGNGKGLEMRMAEVLREIETAYGKTLESWSGRTEDFKGVEEYLLKLVQA